MERRRFIQATAGLAATAITRRPAGSKDPLEQIPALLPRDETGHHFVLYADCCSGIPGTGRAKDLQSVNEMVA